MCTLSESYYSTYTACRLTRLARFFPPQNNLHEGILIASDPELGEGGSWSTCQLGCNKDPPADVAHVQFKSKIAFKLVWCPPSFTQFVLVDDDGKVINRGYGVGNLPREQERQMNFEAVKGSKYALYATELPIDVTPSL